MKKLLFSGLFIGILSISAGKLSAQTSLREPVSTSQKSDDGVLVAYPNPTRDFIILKSKDADLKIKSVTFYSILGMQVLNVEVNMSTAEVRLEKLKPGKYLMRYLMSDNTQKVTQIIKQ